MKLNKVMLHGTVISDPIVKTSNEGQQMMRFTMVTENQAVKQPDGTYKSGKEIHSVTVIGGNVDYIKQKVKAGCNAYVEGRVRYQTVVNKETKAEVKHMDVLVEPYRGTVDVTYTPKDMGYEQKPAPQPVQQPARTTQYESNYVTQKPAPQPSPFAVNEDDIPF